ncbi:MAG: TonB-dependent receptor, partial [Bacteroidota bacterium]
TFAIPNSPLVPVLTDIVLGQLEAGVDTTLRNPDATYNALLPKVGLTYDLTRDVSIGATVQRGYRAGGAEILGDGSTNVYDPEYTWNYEASFRSRWLNGRLTANANFFYTDWTDQQVRLFREGTTLTFTANAGASTLYGAELELRAIPARGLTVFSSVGLVETEFDEFVIGERDLAGFEFPNAVGETVSVGATYESAQGFFGGFSAGYTGTYFDDVNTLEGGGNDPLREAGGYTLVNARIGYVVDVSNTSARIALWSRNLLDETVELRRGFNALDQPTVRFGLPRVVGVSVELEL